MTHAERSERVDVKTIVFKRNINGIKIQATKSRSSSGFCKITIDAGPGSNNIEINSNDHINYEEHALAVASLLIDAAEEPCLLFNKKAPI